MTKKVDLPPAVALAPDIAARIEACATKVAAGIAALEDTIDDDDADDDPCGDFDDEEDISTVKNISALLRSGERARRESTRLAAAASGPGASPGPLGPRIVRHGA